MRENNRSRSTTIVRVHPKFRRLLDNESKTRGCSRIKISEDMVNVWQAFQQEKMEKFKKNRKKGFNDLMGGNLF